MADWFKTSHVTKFTPLTALNFPDKRVDYVSLQNSSFHPFHPLPSTPSTTSGVCSRRQAWIAAFQGKGEILYADMACWFPYHIFFKQCTPVPYIRSYLTSVCSLRHPCAQNLVEERSVGVNGRVMEKTSYLFEISSRDGQKYDGGFKCEMKADWNYWLQSKVSRDAAMRLATTRGSSPPSEILPRY